MNLVKKRYFFAVMIFAFLGFTIKDEETKVITIPPTFVVDVPQMATATPADATANSELLSTSFTLHTGKSFIGFKEALAYRESRGNYTIVNRFGYMGKYQFGKRALSFYGVTDTEQFLNSPEQQEQVFVLSLQRTKWFLRKEIKKYVGKTINGIHITESGILAAAHLAGESSVKKFFKHQGGYNFADGNGVTLQHYLKTFAGYDTSDIEAVQKPQWKAPETTSLSLAAL